MIQPVSKHPTLYELNVRVQLTELAIRLGRPATLDDFPSAELDRLAGLGFEWIWLLGVWQTGKAGRRISRTLPQLRELYQQILPGFRDSDICGSPFAVVSYKASEEFGGESALARLRARLRERGMRLMLDLIPNHTAIDHPWVREHPEFYVRGSSSDVEREPANYLLIPDAGVFAHGRDPYFPGWPDTLQLNYGNDLLQEAMRRELLKIAGSCDGVRCDMAMLLTPEVFQRTWSIEMQPFWPEAIRAVRGVDPEFVFMAEVYWDMEWNLQQQGFDYTYDKRLYDRLRSADASAVRSHLSAGIDFQDKSVRFLENHDEERAAAVFPVEVHRAGALIAYFVPGLRFFHDGQLEGRRKKASVHLCRRAAEPADISLQEFYSQLLSCLRLPAFKNGDWELLETNSQACFAFSWRDGQNRAFVLVNFSPDQSQLHAQLTDLTGTLELRDEMSGAVYQGDAAQLYFDLPAWGYKVLLLGSHL
jgi:hypothetical protein